MMTFAQFLTERDKIIDYGLPKPGEKRGGDNSRPGKLMGKGVIKTVNPYKPSGMQVTGTPWKDRNPSQIMGK